MSIKVMTKVWEAHLPRREKMVLLAIADHVDDEGRGCYASNSRLAYKTEYDERSVQRATNELERMGVLELEGEHPRFGTNIWHINLKRIPMKLPYQDWLREQGPRQNVTPGGDNLSPGGVRMSPKPSDSKPSYEPSGRQSAATGASGPPAMVRCRPPAFDPGEYGADVDDEDPRLRQLPQNPVEQAVVDATHSKYVKPSARSSLRGTKSCAWRGNPVTTYPSPLEYYEQHPEWFSEYVELCRRLIVENSGRPPSQTNLVRTVKNYGRRGTGWLDFLAAKQGDTQDAAAVPLSKRAAERYGDDVPDWMK